MNIKKIWYEIKTVTLLTIYKWTEDNIALHAAGVAFYTIFSLAPMIIIIIGLSGFIFGERAIEGQLADTMEQVMDREMAETIQSFVASARQQQTGLLQSLVGFGILLFASTTVIAQLKDSLNNVWDVRPGLERGTIKTFVIDRVLSLLLIIIFATFLMASFMLDAIFAYMEPVLDPVIPGGVGFWSFLNTMLFVLVVTALFTVIFKLLPDVYIPWKDVLIGSFATTILFLLGRLAIQWYMSGGTVETTYGAAGSFVIFLIWLYYNIMVVFLGAEFTKVYANRYGSNVKPARYAMFTPDFSVEQYRDDTKDEPSGSD
ncbi:MAG: YihY/virulence factor BrkB family protein [Balneolales bacterium]